MDIREFDFDLPAELIAQEPAAERSAAKLLHLERAPGSLTHSTVSALPNLLRAGDVVVVNNTRVFPARLLGRRVLRLWTEDGSSVDEAVDAIGHVPLPPYIKRDDRLEDRDRYQTVFAHTRGSVAAPTAGLHFTPALLDALRARGVEIAAITLHVGYGTFQPVRVTRIEEHRLDAEPYEIDSAAASLINRALAEDRRV